EHRPIVVDAVTKTVVCRIVYACPTEILRDSSSVAPPVRQAQLDMQIIASCYGYHFIQVNKCFFIPIIGRPTKRMHSRPICEITNWSHIVWSTFAEGPNADYLNAGLGGAEEC